MQRTQALGTLASDRSFEGWHLGEYVPCTFFEPYDTVLRVIPYICGVKTSFAGFGAAGKATTEHWNLPRGSYPTPFLGDLLF